jgi:hypothetical protein
MSSKHLTFAKKIMAMQFKKGDKVKFLNETGGGIVSRIVSGSLVYVATEDGFEIPTATKDIIRVNPETKAEKMFDQVFNVDLQNTVSPALEDDLKDKASFAKIKKGSEESQGYYIAFVPADQQWFVTGNIEIRLINHTDGDILYNLLLQNDDDEYFGFDYGSIEAESSRIIESIDRESLPGWANGMLQILVHDEEAAAFPLQSKFHIKAGKFSSEGSYQESGLINERAIIFKIADKKDIKYIPGPRKTVEIREEPVQLEAKEHKKETLIGKYAVGPHAAVVDLHIGELVDNIAGMNSHDMFLMQINHFLKTLESAMVNNFRKVTYIHGVGNGVLKNAIIEKLNDYEGVENKSASLAEYGQGAIDILIYTK